MLPRIVSCLFLPFLILAVAALSAVATSGTDRSDPETSLTPAADEPAR